MQPTNVFSNFVHPIDVHNKWTPTFFLVNTMGPAFTKYGKFLHELSYLLLFYYGIKKIKSPYDPLYKE